MEQRYNNYHKHTHYSNKATLDCVVKPEDYIKRAVELGHTTYFTTEHGFQGNVYEAQTLCEKYNIKPIYGVETYYVDDIERKNTRQTYHLILIGMTEKARYEINKIMSIANTKGFYYKPRIGKKELLSLTASDVIVTSACIASPMFKKDFIIDEEANVNETAWFTDFFLPVHDHFKENFYLEVQNHNVQAQKSYNQKIIILKNKFDCNLIHANDSHYILPEDHKYRDLFLNGKGIFYEDEQNFILDYPDYNTIVERYKKQGILNDKEIEMALQNTLVFDKAEAIYTDKEFKIPLVPNKFIQEELGPGFDNSDNNKVLQEIIVRSYKNKKDNNKLNTQKIPQYIDAISQEVNTVKDCGMASYFVLDHIAVNRAVNKYNAVLTKSGRGCFTGNAVIPTTTGLKYLKDVQVGDYVFDINGNLKRVLETYKYDINEPMVQIDHIYNSGFSGPMTCTLDHEIRVWNDGIYSWKQAQNLTMDDYLVSPKLNFDDASSEYDEYICDDPKTNAYILIDGNNKLIPIKSIGFVKSEKNYVYDLRVEDTHSYILNNVVVHNSSVSFLINNLLGLTEVDRIKAPVKLYPSRFMSAERILSSRSLPD